jgi:hypothetical protein
LPNSLALLEQTLLDILLSRAPLLKGSLSKVDLLVLTSLDQLIFTLQMLFTFVTKQAALMTRSIVLSLSVQLVSLARSNNKKVANYKVFRETKRK